MVLPAPGQGGSGAEPSIPFTGYDSLLQAIVALMLILGGLVLLALSKDEESDRLATKRHQPRG